MNIEELTNIINLLDFDRICEEIEKRGFRRGSEDGVKEFDLSTIKKTSSYQQEVSVDEEPNKNYFATLYQDCKAYGKSNFISFFYSKWVESKGRRAPIPQRFAVFTDAPVNEEYERDIHSVQSCPLCKKEVMKKETLEHDGEFLCHKCYFRTLYKEVSQMLLDEIKKL